MQQHAAAFRTMKTEHAEATREAVSWPTSPGWYWLRDGDGNTDIVHCLEIHGELQVYYTRFHREYDYDKIETWIKQEDFYEYGDCQFIRVNDECPWA